MFAFASGESGSGGDRNSLFSNIGRVPEEARPFVPNPLVVGVGIGGALRGYSKAGKVLLCGVEGDSARSGVDTDMALERRLRKLVDDAFLRRLAGTDGILFTVHDGDAVRARSNSSPS